VRVELTHHRNRPCVLCVPMVSIVRNRQRLQLNVNRELTQRQAKARALSVVRDIIVSWELTYKNHVLKVLTVWLAQVAVLNAMQVITVQLGQPSLLSVLPALTLQPANHLAIYVLGVAIVKKVHKRQRHVLEEPIAQPAQLNVLSVMRDIDVPSVHQSQ